MEFYLIEEEEQKVRLAPLHLEKGPLQWYYWTVDNNGAPLSWKEFEYGLLSVYDRSIIRDYSGNYRNLSRRISLMKNT